MQEELGGYEAILNFTHITQIKYFREFSYRYNAEK